MKYFTHRPDYAASYAKASQAKKASAGRRRGAKQAVGSGVIKYLASFVLMMTTLHSFAQNEVEMADTMRSEGKIYVVVAIVLVILIGLIAYVFLLDRKVSNLEKKLKK